MIEKKIVVDSKTGKMEAIGRELQREKERICPFCDTPTDNTPIVRTESKGIIFTKIKKIRRYSCHECCTVWEILNKNQI